MLSIYFGREDVDKASSLYSKIGESIKALRRSPERGGRILLVVPDQFTLQAERDAFFYLQSLGFMELEVISMSRLRHRIIDETGRDLRIPIGKSGRQMLLSLILRRLGPQLEVFSDKQGLRPTAELINNFISELKLQNVLPEDVEAALRREKHPILRRKLSDLLKVYKDYEEAIAGKYLDSEDQLSLLVNRIAESELIGESEIWLYGFDVLSLRDLDVAQALFCRARNLFVMLTADRAEGAEDWEGAMSAAEKPDSLIRDVQGDDLDAQTAAEKAENSTCNGSGNGLGAQTTAAEKPENSACNGSGNGLDAQSASGSRGGRPDRDTALFRLSRQLIKELRDRAETTKTECHIYDLNKGFLSGDSERGTEDFRGSRRQDFSPELSNRTGVMEHRVVPLRHIEKELYSYPFRAYNGLAEEVTLLSAANYYAEAESAAAEIYRLIREEGYRYHDILVICNDMDARAAVIKRVFSEYNLPVFLDRKKNLLHNPVLEYISALLDIVAAYWKTEDIIRLMRTGFSPLSFDQCELLDEYAGEHRIKRKKDWLRKIEYEYIADAEEGDQAATSDGTGIDGMQSESGGGTDRNMQTASGGDTDRRRQAKAEYFADAEKARAEITEHINKFSIIMEGTKAVEERTAALYLFLRDEAGLPEKLADYISELRESGKHLYADELSQLWDQVMAVFDQMVAVLGGAKLSREDYRTLLAAGLENIEIGLIPTTTDQILIGTMQRTRPGRCKALFVLGANDGVLPSEGRDKGMFNEEERLRVFQGQKFGKVDSIRAEEEQLAIYRNLSRPSKRLWVSFAVSNPDGNELRASLIFEKLRKLFPENPVEKDIRSGDRPLDLVGTRDSTISHLAAAMRDFMEKRQAAGVWRAVYTWFKENAAHSLNAVEDGLFFGNRREIIRKDYVRRLYGFSLDRDTMPAGWLPAMIKLSPSGLERYARCPFSHFVAFGLAPREKRVVEIGPRERGDIFHKILMDFSKELTEKDVKVTDEDSRWMRLSLDDCHKMVDRMFDELLNGSDGKNGDFAGIFKQGKLEEYRTERIKDAAKSAAWALTEQVKAGRIDDMYYEERFGAGRRFPPIVRSMGDLDVLIEGQIDRLDIVSGRAKIIDYKSGNEWFNMEEVKSGWRLQLMLYLQAVTESPDAGESAPPRSKLAARPTELKPAGVFYFRIHEPRLDCGPWPAWDKAGQAERLEQEVRRSFRMDGVVLDDQRVLRSIAGTDFMGKHYNYMGYSDIIPVRAKDDPMGAITLVKNHKDSKKILDEEGFKQLQRDVRDKVDEFCDGLAGGVIDAAPGRTKYMTACRYCNYKGICSYDPTFEG